MRVLIFLICLIAAPAWAEPPATVDILPGWRSAPGRHIAGVRIRLAPGWKTYWRSPGDAGIPPVFGWAGSHNITGAKVHWPVPQVYDAGGMRIIAYEGEVILPVEFALSGDAARIDGVLDFGVCRDICVPMSARMVADLPAGGRPGPALRAALADGPVAAGERPRCDIAPQGRGLRVAMQIDGALPPGSHAVIEPGVPGEWVSEPALAPQGGGTQAVAQMMPGQGLARDQLRLTLFLPDGSARVYRGCR